MNYKLILWTSIFILNIQFALAQTGLFDAPTAGQFAVTGIVVIVIIFVFQDLFNRFIRRKK